MARAHATPVPSALWRRPLRTLRPQDAAGTYAHPRPELARLVDSGALHRVARGFYIVVPPDQVGRSWIPGLEATAAGIAASVYGADQAVLMGISAARALGAIPRALATAVVAVPEQHRPVALIDRPAIIRFVRRNTDSLDAELIETSLGPTLTTTPEQTVLDLAHRPQLGNAEKDVPGAVAALYHRCDVQRLTELAKEQRRSPALRRAEAWTREQ